ncbi:MAG: porin [Arenicellales bacterium]|nr:porin [Arenicellales bacterium]
MNKKLLAAAVASAVAVPGFAAADVNTYGTLYIRTQVQDSNISMIDGATRFGFNSSKDMGNGNTVSGKVELGLDVSDGHINTGNTSRVTTVSFGGDWGSATVGSQWSVMTGPDWVTCALSGASCAGHVGYQGRVADSLVITGPAVGPLALSVQFEADGSDLAAWAVASGIDVGALSITAAYRDTDTNAFHGVGVSGNTAGVIWGASFSDQDVGNEGNGLFLEVQGLRFQYDETGGDSDLGFNYNIPLGGATMRLILVDNEGEETKAAVQFNYSL